LSRARYYSSTLHRFISEDPIGFAGGINAYAYTADDPVNFSDPSGLKRKCSYCGGAGWQGIRFRGQAAWISPTTGKIVDIHGNNIGWGAEPGLEAPTVDPVFVAAGFLAGPVMGGLRGAAAAEATEAGYHATNPNLVDSIMENGLRSSNAGRLGGGGPYVSSTAEGAVAEYSFHNPGGPAPAVLRVEYNPGTNYLINPPPTAYSQGVLPLAADTLTTSSLRSAGVFNTIIRNGSARVTR